MIRRGFTIVELLIVITIMSILLVVGVVNLRGSQVSARDTERKSDIEAISFALESFYRTGTANATRFLRYPSTLLNNGSSANFQSTLRDINLKALTPPGAVGPVEGFLVATNNNQTTTGVLPQPTTTTYVYQPLQNDGSLCVNSNQMCETYNLFYRLESDNTVYKFESKNRGGNPNATSAIDPLTQGLVGWWKLNGNATDTTGQSNGIVYGAIPTTGQNGVANGSYSFNGTNSYIDLGINTSIGNLTNNFSVSVWVYHTGANSSNAVIFAPSRLSSQNGFHLALIGTNVRFTTTGIKDYSSATSTAAPNTWSHLVVVFQNNNATFFVNGIQRDTVTHTAGASINNDDPLYIGSSTQVGSNLLEGPFLGKIDDLRIYNKVLSAANVADIYAQGAQ